MAIGRYVLVRALLAGASALTLSPPVLAAAQGSGAAPAEHAATPEAVVGEFDATLLRVMQDAKHVAYQDRYRELSVTMPRDFDFDRMAQVAIGPAWLNFTPAEKAAIAAALRRFSVASYASEFNDYAGEQFEIVGRRAMQQGVMVTTKMVRPGHDPVTFGYLLQEAADGTWRIIDVYLDGTISQLAVRRSEFSSILAHAGPDGLVERLAEKTRQLEQAATS